MDMALVTGGSEGVGRGVVEGLAEADMRVYFTGRNAERLARTALEAGRLGGDVIARQVDHRHDDEVVALFHEIKRVGSIDLLVNNVWGGYENMVEDGRFTWLDPYWDQPAWRWDAMMNVGVRAAFVASQLATRSMLGGRGGLIVNISFWSAQKHIANALYGMAKAATDKLTADMAAELTSHNINVISLYPGLVRTEKVMANAEFLDLTNSESPRFIGRTIAALYADEKLAAELSGQVCVAAELARILGVVDIDGRSPVPLTLQTV